MNMKTLTEVFWGSWRFLVFMVTTYHLIKSLLAFAANKDHGNRCRKYAHNQGTD